MESKSFHILFCIEKIMHQSKLDFVLREPLSEDIAEWLCNSSYRYEVESKYGIIVISFKDTVGAMEFKLRFM